MNKKITDFTELTTPADDDLIEIVDVSDTSESATGTNKKVQRANIAPAQTTTTIGALIGSAGDATPNNTDYVATALTAGGLLKKITWTNVKAFLKTYFDTLYSVVGITKYSDLNLSEGQMLNGKIVPSVDGSGNLTVALKTKAGTDPSATDPVYVMIGGTLRTITSALSRTWNAGSLYLNLGSAELATKETDLFTKLVWNTNLSAVDLIVSRIPFGDLISEYTDSLTGEKGYLYSGTKPAATDVCVNIGRFAATLSAGAGYTWSVPTFTAANLIQRPIYETRWLDFQPQYSASGSMTYTSVTTTSAVYKIGIEKCFIGLYASGTTGGTASNAIIATLPFGTSDTNLAIASIVADTSGTGISGITYFTSANNLGFRKYDASNFGLGTNDQIRIISFYKI